MKHVTDNVLNEFINACRRIGRLGLVTASAGNLSWRLDDGHFLISGSGSWLAEITPAEVTVCRLEEGGPIEGAKPSMEIGLHAGILRMRPDCRVVLHCQSVHATTVACLPPDNTETFDLIPELPFHVGAVAIVDYQEPGSQELAKAVTAAMQDHNLVLLINHGQVTAGKNFAETIKRALFFEFVCELLCKSQNRAKPMNREEANRLRKRSGSAATKSI